MRLKSKHIGQVAVCMLMILGIYGCNGVPKHVIAPDDMAELMADVHTGEAVVDMNPGKFPTDSSKQVLKQSIYHAHGVTAEQVDTSFEWYGHHLDKYMDVYDKTLKILNKRLEQQGAILAEQSMMSVTGDSVNVWNGAPYIIYDRHMPSPFYTFNLEKDFNWEVGDVYTWRLKMVRNGVNTRWNIVADYEDGATETMSASIYHDGWNEITFFGDSTRTLRRVYGTLQIELPRDNNNEVMEDEIVMIDSISLVRNRLNRKMYPQRYKQRLLRK